jgi:hypothetical protein
VGAWGPGIFSDDAACDVRDEFRTLIGDGVSTEEATRRILSTSSDIASDDFVVLVALAVTQWKSGRLSDEIRERAVAAIDAGGDLDLWDVGNGRRQREAALSKARQQLISPQRPPVGIARRKRSSTPFEPGDIVIYKHDSGAELVFWVIDNPTTKFGDIDSRVELVDIDSSSVEREPQAVVRARARPHAKFKGGVGVWIGDGQELPPDRYRIVGRVHRPEERGRLLTFVSNAGRIRRSDARTDLDQQLDGYV